MNYLHIESAGLLTTIQDLGRFGWAQYGVSASGAADPVALRAGNLLVGNAENAAALEMTLIGAQIVFEQDAVIALTGSDFGAGIPLWSAVEIKHGDAVRCGPTQAGARCYLCVRGGIAAPKIMGSASMHVMTGVGGRRVQRGDRLPVGNEAVRKLRAPAAFPEWCRPPFTLRATAGPQEEWFSGELFGPAYTVSEESNRMGLRLRGPAIPSPAGQMITEGVALGAVQAPPDGQPIILFVEHQTTGGYPKPANVVSADFWKLGQLRPRDQVQFEGVTIEQAWKLMQRQEAWLRGI